MAWCSPRLYSFKKRFESCQGSLSSSQRIVALGGDRRAPKQLTEGCRWVGGEDNEIDATLCGDCAEGSEGGQITDLPLGREREALRVPRNFHYKFLRGIQGLEEHRELRSLDLSASLSRKADVIEGVHRGTTSVASRTWAPCPGCGS